jgi:RNA polymerase sigma factor (TIGR02999 family)
VFLERSVSVLYGKTRVERDREVTKNGHCPISALMGEDDKPSLTCASENPVALRSLLLRGKVVGMGDVTCILAAVKQGDASAADQLLPVLYGELRKLAAARLTQEKPGQTLQPTALVHEAYLRLTHGEHPQHWSSRGHFFAAAAEAMRRILVENARRKNQSARGGDFQRVPLDAANIAEKGASEDLLALDESLGRLEAHDPTAAKLVKLRYFAGLTMSQSAEALGISQRTAERNWTYARTWLHRDLG